MVKELQTEMVYSAQPEATADLADVEWLVAVLKDRGWLTADKIEVLSQGSKSERKIRAIARAAAPGVFSFPGSPGYKLWQECTMEEINRGLAAMESQIRDMTVRRAIYERAYHSRFGGLR